MSGRSRLRETAERLLRTATTPATSDQLVYWIAELDEAEHQMAEGIRGADRRESLVRFIEHYRRELDAGVDPSCIAALLKHDIATAEGELAELEVKR
jgi:hypothetical protein